MGHATAARYIKLLGQERWDKHYRFSFIRNPWARYVSMYSFFRTKPAHECHKEGFEYWLRHIDRWTVLQPQWNFIAIDDEVVVDIFRFEQLQAEWTRCQQAINAHSSHGKMRVKPLVRYGNNTRYRHYSTWYNESLRAYVAEREAKIIEYGGYTFEEA